MEGAGLDSVVSVDGIGRVTAHSGGLVLHSAFQLIFAQRGDSLQAVAAEGFLRPFLGGAPVAPRGLLDASHDGRRAFIERLCTVLHMRNRHLAGGGDLDLVIAGAALPNDPALLAADIEASGIDPARLVWSLRPPLPDDAAALAAKARSHGARIAVTGAADGSLSFDAIRAAAPDIVRIDGEWFRRVSENEAALRLMARLIDGFRSQGMRVAVEGIETQRQLAAALYLGPDLYQGYLLARPELAGTGAGDRHLPLSRLFCNEAKVIPLKSAR